MAEWKIECRVNRQFDWIAHIVQHDYSHEFRPWFGSVDLNATAAEGQALSGKQLYLQLADGRQGIAMAIKYVGNDTFVPIGDQLPGTSAVLYFVGITTNF